MCLVFRPDEEVLLEAVDLNRPGLDVVIGRNELLRAIQGELNATQLDLLDFGVPDTDVEGVITFVIDGTSYPTTCSLVEALGLDALVLRLRAPSGSPLGDAPIVLVERHCDNSWHALRLYRHSHTEGDVSLRLRCTDEGFSFVAEIQ